MRAILVVNHTATTTSFRIRDVLVQALSHVVDLRIEHTAGRGHAAALAREAAKDGVDLVVVLGGDGTVNEAINGLLADPAGPVPAFAVVPGGSTNVFARALGLPGDWVEATGVLLEALRSNRSRLIGLGRADERYFTFCAGLGLDAEVVRRVERARQDGQQSRPTLYLGATLAQYARSNHKQSPMMLKRAGADPEQGFAAVVVQNTAPWTYLHGRPINACPDASFDLGLDVMALRGLRLPSTARAALQLFSARPGPRGRHAAGPRGRHVLRLHDVPEFSVKASEPVAFQVDGDYLGERSEVRFCSAPAALRVIC